ncbi:hypothetical protein B0H63DRAFT_427652 [Podospora didyma]|uniref:FAD-binding PCMH-type domain-containing protein n=1 Tax=Podospora didyma TaxID=330526 RepID=A0AAE0U3H8_9PEZI|nr:hypothetical protein B0H63DRAFT_427652 [Podospora didyma]
MASSLLRAALRAAPLILPLFALTVQGDTTLLDFEQVQLDSKHSHDHPALSFAKTKRGGGNGNDGQEFGHTHPPETECRAFPGSDDWPSDNEWRRFNTSLGGALLKPLPPAAACYTGTPSYNLTQCRYIVNNASSGSFFHDDPVQILTQWTEGNTCLPAINATGTCSQGGFPVYVVNATTVKHVQAAVNFARNNNIRLVIKNTGHDFGGRSVGAGSLSVWTHHLDSFQYLPRYTQGNYTGMAAQFGSGLQAWRVFNYMYDNGNITIVGPGLRSVGANGGWFASGGHGNLASFYGLGADQALEIHVVTADGRFVVANADENEDLFYALRGGGGSTYGVVTSVIVKAYPPINTTRAQLSIACRPPADTNARAPLAQITNATFFVNDTALYWKALGVYFQFKKTIVDAGGVDWDYLYPLQGVAAPTNGTVRNGTTNATVPATGPGFSFRVAATFPNRTVDQVATILAPLYAAFRAVPGLAHITLTRSEISTSPYAGARTPVPGSGLSQTRYRSRILPRVNWATEASFETTMSAIRAGVEDGGYTWHGLSIGATNDVAGYPGRTAAVNPAWRNGILHGIFITQQPTGLTTQAARDEEARIQRYMSVLRAVSPGAGAYMNEGDPGEPDWQQAFYGSNYNRLLNIKRRRDPWGVFWAPTTVGSEAWEVRTADGYPRSQNGRLCRVRATTATAASPAA